MPSSIPNLVNFKPKQRKEYPGAYLKKTQQERSRSCENDLGNHTRKSLNSRWESQLDDQNSWIVVKHLKWNNGFFS